MRKSKKSVNEEPVPFILQKILINILFRLLRTYLDKSYLKQNGM